MLPALRSPRCRLAPPSRHWLRDCRWLPARPRAAECGAGPATTHLGLLPSPPMKHLLFALLLVTSTLPGPAQTTPAAHPTAPDQYCTVIARGAHYGALQFQLDYGQQSAKYTGITAEQAKEDNARLKELFSVADVLNYLSGRGWSLVSVSTLLSDVQYPQPSTTVHSVGDVTATVRSEVQYLLRRPGK